MKYTEKQIKQVIIDCSARNLFDKNATEDEKRKLAIEFLEDTEKDKMKKFVKAGMEKSL